MANPPDILRFDDYSLDPESGALRKSGEPVALPAQPARLLVLLARQAGKVVSHEDIREHLWGDQVVDFAGGVHVCIRQIRAALGDDASEPRYIENVPRRGYRFVAATRAGAGFGLRQNPAVLRKLGGAGLFVAAVAAGFLVTSLITGSFDKSDPYADSPAQDAYARGQYVLESDEQDAGQRSRRFFLEAIEADPAHAPAYAAVAETYQQQGDFDNARTYAEKALSLDDGLAEAYLRLGAVHALGDWDWSAAETTVHKALELDWESAEAHHALATVYSVTGRLSEALAEMAFALSLDPVSTLLRADYGSYLYYAGDLKGARMQCQAALSLDPFHYPSSHCLFNVAVQSRDYVAAVELAGSMMQMWNATDAEVRRVVSLPTRRGVQAFERWRLTQYQRLSAVQPVEPVAFALVFASLGNHVDALSHLEQGFEQRSTMTPFVLADPVFAPLRSNRRFRALLKKMNVRLDSGS